MGQTLYLRSTQSAVVSGVAAIKLLNTSNSGSIAAGPSIKNAKNTGTWQFIPGTSSNTTAYTASTNPNSQGWLFDGSVPGTYAATGNWTLGISISDTSASGTFNLKASLWVVTATSSSITKVSQLFETQASASSTLPGVRTGVTWNVAASTVGAVTLTAGQYLYLEVYLNVTAAGTSTTATCSLYWDGGSSDLVTPAFTASETLTATLYENAGNVEPELVQKSSAVTTNAISASTTGSITPANLTGLTIGHVLLAFIGIDNSATSISAPSGWTAVPGTFIGSGANAVAVFSIPITTGSEGTSQTFTCVLPSSASATITGWYGEYENVDTSAPVAAGTSANAAAASGTVSLSTITSARDGSRGVAFAFKEDSATFTGSSDTIDSDFSDGSGFVSQAVVHETFCANNGATWTPSLNQSTAVGITYAQFFLQPPVQPLMTKAVTLKRGASLVLSGAVNNAISLFRSASLVLTATVNAVWHPGGGTTTNVNLTATLQALGAQTKNTSLIRAASLVFTGARSLAVTLKRSASLVLSGAVTKTVILTRSATLSFTASKAVTTTKKLAGTITASGAATKTASFIRSATLSATGALKKTVTLTRSAILVPLGSKTMSVTKKLAGTISASGSVVASHAFIVALNGAMALAGATNKTVNLIRSATFSFAGSTPLKTVGKALTGSISFTGAVNKAVSSRVSSALSPSGGIRKTVNLVRSAVLSFAAAVQASLGSRVFQVTVNATLAVIGSASKAVGLTRSAMASPTSTLGKTISLVRVALISPVGSIRKSIGKAIAAVLAAIGGVVTRLIPKATHGVTITLPIVTSASMTSSILASSSVTLGIISSATDTLPVLSSASVTLPVISSASLTIGV